MATVAAHHHTLTEWANAFGLDESGSAVDPRAEELLNARYGKEERVLTDRRAVYRDVLKKLTARGSEFSATEKVALLGCPGRDRLFGGHIDYPGSGGFTVDCASLEEDVIVVQPTSDGIVRLRNASTEFPPIQFSLSEVADVARREKETFSKANWDTSSWASYVKAALAMMLCARFRDHEKVRAAFKLPADLAPPAEAGVGLLVYVAAQGALALPSSGGMSSSGALTGAISMAVSSLFGVHISLPVQAQVDFGEYFLGKAMGASDKMAQLYSARDKLAVIGTVPERSLTYVPFVSSRVAVLMAECPVPRLTTSRAPGFLKSVRGYTPEHAAAAVQWGQAVMHRFGSHCTAEASKVLEARLQDPAAVAAAGLSESDAKILLDAFLASSTRSQLPDEQKPNNGPFRPSYDGPLLREFCAKGTLERLHFPDWEDRFRRYKLVYKALKLIPLRVEKTGADGLPYDLEMRKAALYTLAEIERAEYYLREQTVIAALEQRLVQAERGSECDTLLRELESHVDAVVELSRTSQNADRAVLDYRRPLQTLAAPTTRDFRFSTQASNFEARAWLKDPRNDCSNDAIDTWLADVDAGTDRGLGFHVGGFERSLPDMDDLADALDREFTGRASLRVSAAGLGGRVCIHMHAAVVQEVKRFIEQAGWPCRELLPSSPIQLLALDADPVAATSHATTSVEASVSA